ncbi:MAG TPA: C1 family peptidase [Elusimicrobiota bacterium]|nr:C1 family peptidase [Elusimicrobiota bacterium]
MNTKTKRLAARALASLLAVAQPAAGAQNKEGKASANDPLTKTLQQLQEQAASEGWRFSIGPTSALQALLSGQPGLSEDAPGGATGPSSLTNVISRQLDNNVAVSQAQVDRSVPEDSQLPASYSTLDAVGGLAPDVADQSLGHTSHCGSCWAFATAGAIGFYYALLNRKKADFSPQELVDCAYGAEGLAVNSCKGGSTMPAFDYARDHGIALWNNDPYIGRQKSCGRHPAAARVQTYTKLESPNGKSPSVAQIKGAIYIYGAVTATVMDNHAFAAYTGGGVFGESGHGCDTSGKVNHWVDLVGWGTDAATNTPYWILRNSYGTNFGYGGYMKIAQTNAKTGGPCGALGKTVVFATIKQ